MIYRQFSYFFLLLWSIRTLSQPIKKLYVRVVDRCPTDLSSWEKASRDLNCTPADRYQCTSNQQQTALVEFCYDQPTTFVLGGHCWILLDSNFVDIHNCSGFTDGCPKSAYRSDELYKYQKCMQLDKLKGCFRADRICLKQRSTNTTEVPGSTTTRKVTTATNGGAHKIIIPVVTTGSFIIILVAALFFLRKRVCKEGFYGTNCLHVCGHCARNATCHHVDGSCPAGYCKPGWKHTSGRNCDQECDDGLYGLYCLKNCSGHCAGGLPFRKTDGACSGGCMDGWTGSYCSEACKEGFYGTNCLSICGHCAGNTTCNHVDGSCPAGYCKPGWKHASDGKCDQECDDGTFGYNCLVTCSGHCTGGAPCSKTDGLCPGGCVDGWTNPYCSGSRPFSSQSEPRSPGFVCKSLCSNVCNAVCKQQIGE